MNAEDRDESLTKAGPLQGVRVLDISRFIAGPYAGQLLGHLGADVVKVEEPGNGDPMRHLSKFTTAAGSSHFLAGNASKRSVTIDLKAAAGRDLFLRLVAHCDVLIENFRPGVMERLGLGHDILVAANPRLILSSVTGFGKTGPWRDWAAYDLIAQAMGGGMSLTGRAGEPAVKMGVPIGDVGASLYAVIGILAALYHRDRTGRGEVIDVGMFDVQLSLLNYHAHYYWASGQSPEPEGDRHPNIVPYQTFETATRPLVVAVYGDPFWPGFCRALTIPDIERDPRFACNAQRLANAATLEPILAEHFLTRSREAWLTLLTEQGVPAGPLHSVGEAVDSSQAHVREMVVEVDGPDGAPLNMLGSPLKFRNCDTSITAPPALGAHTDEILRDWAGCAPDELAKLRGDAII
jgi:crotonobetainyl-CoA:carnitine CoA-transferase CaiB-like acyl-CoA transferase